MLPVMQDFVEIVPVKGLLKDAGIDCTRNFEEIYSDIVLDANCKDLLSCPHSPHA